MRSTKTQKIASQSISIPINPNLTIKEIKFIVKILNSFWKFLNFVS